MQIKEIFNSKNLVVSFEIFPPKNTSSVETIYRTLEELGDLEPDFISVTYGAGGSVMDNKTCELSALVRNKYKIEALAHLTCINSSRRDIDYVLEQLKENKISNVLALRGDISRELGKTGEYNYAYELIKHLKGRGDFSIGAACYPEGHIESESLDKDIEALKFKVDCGADFLVSQLFFNNDSFYNFLEKAASKGINIPVQAGIMPVTNKKQIERMVQLSGASLPEKFLKIMNKYEHNPEALRDAGIAYSIDQIIDLISSGVRGIHLYTMNNPTVARRITKAIGSLVEHINK